MLQQAQMEGDLQEVDTLFGRLLNSNVSILHMSDVRYVYLITP